MVDRRTEAQAEVSIGTQPWPAYDVPRSGPTTMAAGPRLSRDKSEQKFARSSELMPLLLVGAPVRHAGRLYNAAAAIHRGRLLGVVPNIHLPNDREFYERRHFASGAGTEGEEIRLGSHLAPFGPDLRFAASDVPGIGRTRRDL